MVQEIAGEKDYLGGATVQTVYFGGGTPSLLSLQDCERLLQALRVAFPLDNAAEITLEANPDDITPEKLQGWKSMGINRLSIGIQSFFEEELRWMNRAHNATHARNCIEWSLAAGITNLSVDLIYGSPLLDDDMWRRNVDLATGYGIPHLSCYALTVEEKTPLHKLQSGGKTAPVNPDVAAAQFSLLMPWMREKGYEHYEVSNFALPGFRSRHNTSYWKGLPYLGIGPSAHSFNGKERRWNIANNSIYIQSAGAEQPQRESEILSRKDRINETVMISLRTREGIDLQGFESSWGAAERARIEKDLEKYIGGGYVRKDHYRACLTEKGMLMADGIAADLFL